MKSKTIRSIEDLRKEMPHIIAEYGNNTDIARAAIANPVLALEKIGYTLSKGMQKEVEYYVRFGEKNKDRVLALEKQVYEHTACEFDLEDDNQLEKQLKTLLSDNSLNLKKSGKSSKVAFRISEDKAVSAVKTVDLDPLQAHVDKHKVVPLLIEARKIYASSAKLSSSAVFKQLLDSKEINGLKLNNIQFRFTHK